MADDLIESNCSKHGLERHVAVHEAGHAVAAIDNDLRFRAVVLYADADAPKFTEGLYQAAAAVDAGPDAAAWVTPDPLGSLRFVMGGVAAEHAVLGDSIEGGWTEDIKVWRRGSGRTGQQTEDQLAEYIGKPMMDVWREATAWAEQNVDRIEAVAAVIGEHEAPWEMSEQQVRDVLDAL